jgi:hypothetical protein
MVALCIHSSKSPEFVDKLVLSAEPGTNKFVEAEIDLTNLEYQMRTGSPAAILEVPN